MGNNERLPKGLFQLISVGICVGLSIAAGFVWWVQGIALFIGVLIAEALYNSQDK